MARKITQTKSCQKACVGVEAKAFVCVRMHRANTNMSNVFLRVHIPCRVRRLLSRNTARILLNICIEQSTTYFIGSWSSATPIEHKTTHFFGETLRAMARKSALNKFEKSYPRTPGTGVGQPPIIPSDPVSQPVGEGECWARMV